MYHEYAGKATNFWAFSFNWCSGWRAENAVGVWGRCCSYFIRGYLCLGGSHKDCVDRLFGKAVADSLRPLEQE